jgi:acetyl-CoA C-acetyltransferase
MVGRVRARRGAYGLVAANGGLMTKQAIGIFSTIRPVQAWASMDGSVQSQLDGAAYVPLAQAPQGDAWIETYSILHDRSGPQSCVLFGRLIATNERFVAQTPSDMNTLASLESIEGLGLRGRVRQQDGLNVFVPEVSAGHVDMRRQPLPSHRKRRTGL